MTAAAIRKLRDATPFVPFQLIVSSGKSYLVPHPDFLHFSPSGRTAHVYPRYGE
jgi:hypothetical protein